MSVSSLLQVVERKQTGEQEEDLSLLRFLPASNHCVRNMCECVCSVLPTTPSISQSPAAAVFSPSSGVGP
jgi:hypothetical protein